MKHLLLVCFSLLLLSACTSENKDNKASDSIVDEKQQPAALESGAISQQDSIKATGRQILTFLKEQNYEELSKYFATAGVRFVPYAFIDTKINKKLTPDEFLEAIAKKWILTWGSYDGTGEPIKLTVSDYVKKFVYNADYLSAEATAYDAIMKQGNSINNIKDIYPNHHFIDYHFSGFDQKYEGMDWTSLRLVFTEEDGQYFLVAIIHDQWTI